MTMPSVDDTTSLPTTLNNPKDYRMARYMDKAPRKRDTTLTHPNRIVKR
jgi:hypothetical protein